MMDISPTTAMEIRYEISLLGESDDSQGRLYHLIEQSGFFSDIDRDEIGMLAV